MSRKALFLLVVFALVLSMASAASAQKTTILRVVIVKTDNAAAYAQALEKGKEIMKRLDVSYQVRVWQATFAGPNAGTVVAAIEYPSLAALADAQAKLAADKEGQAWMKELDKIRTIVSDSIYREL
jgi:ABC-type sugar transport system substrate-binding protein